MSATASSALFQSFESLRFTAGAAVDLQLPECEKVRQQARLKLTADAVPTVLGLPPTAAAATHGREHACLASTGAVRLAARATAAILVSTLSKTQVACSQESLDLQSASLGRKYLVGSQGPICFPRSQSARRSQCALRTPRHCETRPRFLFCDRFGAKTTSPRGRGTGT